ncbi:hypothetical protein ACMX25_33115, partial [Caballeronia sp. 15715]|uniref:hypothetical protein n=1 Tax=Caballeronia sp. 15715 TaxID=3391030 RepID=UPI0039E6A2E6
RPVVNGLAAHAKLGGYLGQLDPASEQQHACGPGASVAMFVIHAQLLQRLILGFGQLYDTLHRYPGVMTTPKVNKIQTRLPATLITSTSITASK